MNNTKEYYEKRLLVSILYCCLVSVTACAAESSDTSKLPKTKPSLTFDDVESYCDTCNDEVSECRHQPRSAAKWRELTAEKSDEYPSASAERLGRMVEARKVEVEAFMAEIMQLKSLLRTQPSLTWNDVESYCDVCKDEESECSHQVELRNLLKP